LPTMNCTKQISSFGLPNTTQTEMSSWELIESQITTNQTKGKNKMKIKVIENNDIRNLTPVEMLVIRTALRQFHCKIPRVQEIVAKIMEVVDPK
jgi:hypothetical protein